MDHCNRLIGALWTISNLKLLYNQPMKMKQSYWNNSRKSMVGWALSILIMHCSILFILTCYFSIPRLKLRVTLWRCLTPLIFISLLTLHARWLIMDSIFNNSPKMSLVITYTPLVTEPAMRLCVSSPGLHNIISPTSHSVCNTTLSAPYIEDGGSYGYIHALSVSCLTPQ